MELTDEIIMQQVKEGNLQEMAVLFERYHVKLFNFFLKHTGNRNVSQDLTQNLFYRILKYRSTFRDTYSFKSWIYQMARNVHFDHCKQNRKQQEKFALVDDHNENVSDHDDSFTEEDYGRLDNALAKLGDDEREVLILSKFQGLKYEEISKINNTTVAAIKVQVHRAIKQLRTIYFKHA